MLAIFYLSSIPLKPGNPAKPTPTPHPDSQVPQITPKIPLPGSAIAQNAASSQLPLNEIFHVFEFGGLYFWLAYALQRPNHKKIPQLTRKQTLWALALTVIFMLFDEIHQIFVPGRNFQGFDLATNLLGVLVMIIVLKVLNAKKKEGH